MSDPLAVSILSKLTSWYSYENDLTDAHGANDLVTEPFPAGYESGPLGQRLQALSRAACPLSVGITNTTGNLTIGGWLTYTAPTPNRGEFGFTSNDIDKNEIFFLQFANDSIQVYGFHFNPSTPSDGWGVTDPRIIALSYPFTVRVEDSGGRVATSNQLIRVEGEDGLLPPGSYFVVATWINGIARLYVDGQLAATAVSAPASIRRNTISFFDVGNHAVDQTCVAAQDETFFCTGAALTAQEIEWLYNMGEGRTYSDVVAAAA